VSTLRTTLLLALLVALRFWVDLSTLTAEPSRYQQWEDAYNATVATWLWHGLPVDAALKLQLRPFCGGCSVVSAVGAPVLGVLGDRLLAWKLVPMLWSAATMLVGFFALDRHAGRAAAWAFAGLFAVPATGFVDTSLVAWGTHPETTLLALAMALLAARPLALGALASAALWFSKTSIYGVVVWAPIALAKTGRARAMLGLAMGAALFAVPAGGADPARFEFEELLPEGWEGARRRAAALFVPVELGRRAFPNLARVDLPALALLAGAALGVVAVAVDRDRRRLPFVGMLLAYGALYVFGGFDVSTLGADAVPAALRWHAPWLALLAIVTAAGVGPWLAAPGARRAVAVAGLALPLVATLHGNVARLTDHDTGERVAGRTATDAARLILVAGERVDPERLAAATSDDPAVERAFRAAEGLARARLAMSTGVSRDQAMPGLGPDVLFGLGLGFAARQWRDEEIETTNKWLVALPPASAEALGSGMGTNLGFAMAKGPSVFDASGATRGVVRRLRAGLGKDDPCWLCVGAGRTAASGCGAWRSIVPESLPECLVEAANDSGEAKQVLYGAGTAWARPGRDVAQDQRLADAISAAGGDGEAFLAGTRAPVAGINSAVRFSLKSQTLGKPARGETRSTGMGARTADP
jgi:hypothetical protein